MFRHMIRLFRRIQPSRLTPATALPTRFLIVGLLLLGVVSTGYSQGPFYRWQRRYIQPSYRPSYPQRVYVQPQRTQTRQPYAPPITSQPSLIQGAVIPGTASSPAPTRIAPSQPSSSNESKKPAGYKPIEQKPLAAVRVPGEFERQRAIMLSVSDWMPHHFPILKQIVESTADHVNLLILYNDLDQLRSVAKTLSESKTAYPHVYFSPLELDTIWLRDFGPRIAELDEGWISIDFFYEGSRPRDDSFPKRWAVNSGIRLRTVRWTVQGGNLLSNGSGLGITTERIFTDNNVQFPNPSPGMNPQQEARNMVTRDFKRCFHLDDLVVLEPLQQEATRHADMFVTLLAPDKALVAQVDAWRDPVNAAILDRNARRLQSAKIDGRPMEVHRIRIPPREGTYWSPYTNIIIANNLVLMPTFNSDDPNIVRSAIATYQRLLPSHTVKTIDMTSMKTLQGSLHCLSMNLPEGAPWPKKYYTYQSTIDGLEEETKTRVTQPRSAP